jgi:hypothetical protein
VAETTGKEMKPHTICNILIHPACAASVRTMFGTEAEGIKNKSLSDVKINRCISNMSINIEKKCF